MQQLIKLHYPIMVQSTDDEVGIDYEERCTICYSAGSIIRPRISNKENSQIDEYSKKEIVTCLQEMTDGADESEHDSTEWIKAVDRGGLIHINDVTFSVFMEIEMVVRRQLESKRAQDQDLNGLVGVIVNDEKVLFSWAIASVSWDEEVSGVILKLIADQWITMRGFSFAKSLMERYKQRNKKNIQKSKGLRKQLQKPGTSEEQTDHDDLL